MWTQARLLSPAQCCEQVFLAIAVFLGDGLYHFTKISIISLWAIKDGVGEKSKKLPVAATPTSPATPDKVSPHMRMLCQCGPAWAAV